MPKLTRQTFIQFGSGVNTAADICQFGSPATGSPVYTAVIGTLQALAAWTTGWAAETVANNRPFLEDMNAVCYVFSYMIAYLLQMGIAEWDVGTTYYTNSVVQYNGILYQSLIDNNINITPVVGVSWKTLKISAQVGPQVIVANNTIFQAATDIFVTAIGEANAPLVQINAGVVIGTWTQNNITQINDPENGGQIAFVCMYIPKGWYWEATGANNQVTYSAVGQ